MRYLYFLPALLAILKLLFPIKDFSGPVALYRGPDPGYYFVFSGPDIFQTDWHTTIHESFITLVVSHLAVVCFMRWKKYKQNSSSVATSRQVASQANVPLNMDHQPMDKEGFLSYGWPFILVIGTILLYFVVEIDDDRQITLAGIVLSAAFFAGLFAGMIKVERALEKNSKERLLGSMVLNGIVTLFLSVLIIMQAGFYCYYFCINFWAYIWLTVYGFVIYPSIGAVLPFSIGVVTAIYIRRNAAAYIAAIILAVGIVLLLDLILVNTYEYRTMWYRLFGLANILLIGFVSLGVYAGKSFLQGFHSNPAEQGSGQQPPASSESKAK